MINECVTRHMRSGEPVPSTITSANFITIVNNIHIMASTDQYEWPVDPSRYDYAQVSNEEFAQRHDRVRALMDELEVDSLLVQGSNAIWDRAWTNMRWLTNHVGCQLSQAEYVVFPRDPDKEITVSTIDMFAEMPARRARAVVDDIRPSGFRCINGAVERLEELGHGDETIGLVEVDPRLGLPQADHAKLEQAFPDAEIRSVVNEWWDMRRVKSDEEIEFIEKSAKIGDRVMERMIEEVEAGMTEASLYGMVADEMTQHGGELPTMILLESTSMADSDDAFQRERARNRTLSEGDIIVNEHAPRYPDGSESQFGTTISLGEPTEDYQEMIDLMFEVHEDVVDNLRPGNTSSDIAEAAEPIEESDYIRESPLAHSELGGGVGASSSIGLPMDMEEEDFELKENMVFVPEVHVSNEEGTKGAFVCDTYVVTDGAPRRLNDFPLEHIVV